MPSGHQKTSKEGEVMTSFFTLMQQNLAYQRDQIELDDAQFSELHKDMAGKVDAYHDYLDFLESEAKRYSEQAKMLTERSRIASRLVERLLERASTVLELNDDRDVAGDVWRMCVKKSKYVNLLTDITYDVYAKLAVDHPDLFTVDYKVSKSELKELLSREGCSDAVKSIAELAERKSVNFKPMRKK